MEIAVINCEDQYTFNNGTGSAMADGQAFRGPGGLCAAVAALQGVDDTMNGVAKLSGIADILAATGDTWAAGVPIWWDDTNSKAVAVRPTTGTYWFAGFALEAKVSGQLKNRVLLNRGLRTQVIEYTVVAGDDTANTVDIPTGFSVILGDVVQVRRAGAIVAVQGQITTSRSGGTITVADHSGSTPAGFTLTTDDVVVLVVTGY